MRSLAFLFLVGLAAVYLWQGWVTPFHLAATPILAAAFVPLVVLVRRKRREKKNAKRQKRENKVPRGKLVLFPAVSIATVSLLLAALFELLEGTRFHALFADLGHAKLVVEVDELTVAEHFAEAASAIERYLAEKPRSKSATDALAQRLVLTLTEAARRTGDLGDGRGFLARALATSECYGVPASEAKTLLALADEDLDFLAGIEADIDGERFERARTKLRDKLDLRESSPPPVSWELPLKPLLSEAALGWCLDDSIEPSESLARIEEALADVPPEHQEELLSAHTCATRLLDEQQRAHATEGKARELIETSRFEEAVAFVEPLAESEPYSTLIFDALEGLAACLDDPEERVAVLSRADSLSRRLDAELPWLAPAFERARAELAARPAELPGSAKVEIVRVGTALSPLVTLDVAVEDFDGSPIEGLSAKDFFLSVDGREQALLAEGSRTKPLPAHVLFLIDRSKSTKDEPLAFAKRGTAAGIHALATTETSFRILSFDAKPHSVCGWTRSAPVALRALDSISAGGYTKLVDAIYASLDELRDRRGRRYLVVFADGDEKGSKSTLSEVINLALRSDVVVLAVALPGKNSPTILKSISESTGGVFLEALTPQGLLPHFDSVSRTIARRTYRLAASLSPDALRTRASLLVTVGRHPHSKRARAYLPPTRP